MSVCVCVCGKIKRKPLHAYLLNFVHFISMFKGQTLFFFKEFWCSGDMYCSCSTFSMHVIADLDFMFTVLSNQICTAFNIYMWCHPIVFLCNANQYKIMNFIVGRYVVLKTRHERLSEDMESKVLIKFIALITVMSVDYCVQKKF